MTIKEKLNNALALVSVLVLALFMFVNTAYAGSLNTQYVTMSSSTPGASSVTWTVHFKPSTTTGIKQIGLKVCTTDAEFAASCTVPTGLSMPASGGVTLTGFGDTVVTSAAYASPLETIVKTNTTAEVTGTDHQIAIAGITNPNAGVFYIRLRTYSDTGTTTIDNGATASATIAAVTVSGTQRETLSVTVAGANSQSICGVTTGALANDATTVNFGDFNGTTAIDSGQSVQVTTNAVNGYTTSVIANHGLLNGSTYINDAPQIGDGGLGTVASTWSAYTGFGICASGGDYYATNYYSNPNYYFHAISNGAAGVSKTIASSSGAANAVTTYVDFRVNVSATVPAGTYSNTVDYAVTPKY